MSRRVFLKIIATVGVGLKVRHALALASPDAATPASPPTAPAQHATGRYSSRAAHEALLAEPALDATARDAFELQRSPLAGFQYHEGEALWLLLTVGDVVDLVREPENAFDERAVRVDWQGSKLGYVPRMDNAAVSQLLDRGEPVRAVIVELRESHDPWERVGLRIDLVER